MCWSLPRDRPCGASSVLRGWAGDSTEEAKHCVREGKPLLARTAANRGWALDFVHDAVECGRTIRVLSVVDAFTRECLALEVDASFASRIGRRRPETLPPIRPNRRTEECTPRVYLRPGIEDGTAVAD